MLFFVGTAYQIRFECVGTSMLSIGTSRMRVCNFVMVTASRCDGGILSLKESNKLIDR
jgi:hypothetical protein